MLKVKFSLLITVGNMWEMMKASDLQELNADAKNKVTDDDHDLLMFGLDPDKTHAPDTQSLTQRAVACLIHPVETVDISIIAGDEAFLKWTLENLKDHKFDTALTRDLCESANSLLAKTREHLQSMIGPSPELSI